MSGRRATADTDLPIEYPRVVLEAALAAVWRVLPVVDMPATGFFDARGPGARAFAAAVGAAKLGTPPVLEPSADEATGSFRGLPVSLQLALFPDVVLASIS